MSHSRTSTFLSDASCSLATVNEDRMPTQTVELTREMFHCPSWCVVPLAEHAGQLKELEDGASHYSGPWQNSDEHPIVGSFTERDGSNPTDGWPGVWVGPNDPITPTAARAFAAELIAAADLANTA
jgi:hypothetical protein